MKLDLVMWTKNSGTNLVPVLKRINQVIPNSFVNRKIIVDDNSSDYTRSVATFLGWEVYRNKGSGISDGANTALDLVESEFFCSFEQDVILAEDWWSKVALPFFESGLAVSSGMRFNSQPKGVTTLFRYVAKKYRGEQLSPWLKSREANAFTLGKTLDNTIYRTESIRRVGGFPYMKVNAGVDTVLAWKLEKYGLKWKVDYNVQSVHLRKGLKDELNHQKWYGTQTRYIWGAMNHLGMESPVDFKKTMFKLCLAPFSGLFVAFKTREASIVYIHPLIRLYNTWGLLQGPQESKVFRCEQCGESSDSLKLEVSLGKYICSTCKVIERKEMFGVD